VASESVSSGRVEASAATSCFRRSVLFADRVASRFATVVRVAGQSDGGLNELRSSDAVVRRQRETVLRETPKPSATVASVTPAFTNWSVACLKFIVYPY
jgi:hypothetical protein